MATAPPAPTPRPVPDPEREGALLEELVRLLAAEAPAGWRVISYRAAPVGGPEWGRLGVVTAEGRETAPVPPVSLNPVVERLKDLWYVPGEGTWLDMRLVVEAPGRHTVEYDHVGCPPPAEAYPVLSLWEWERYPRDEEHVPRWWRETLEKVRGLDVEALRGEFAALVRGALEHEGLTVLGRRASSLRLLTPEGRPLALHDIDPLFARTLPDRLLTGPAPEPNAPLARDTAAKFVRAVLRGVRDRGRGHRGEGPDTAVGAVVAELARRGVRSFVTDADVLVLSGVDGRGARTDLTPFRERARDAFEGRMEEAASWYADRVTAWFGRSRAGEGAEPFDHRLRVSLRTGRAPFHLFPDRALRSETGLHQWVVLDGPLGPADLEGVVYGDSARTYAEVHAEAVRRSIAEPVETVQGWVDGARLVTVKGAHPYAAAQTHVLERHTGELAHGAIVAFPDARTVLAHPLGQGDPIAAMEGLNGLLARWPREVGWEVDATRSYWWHPSSRERADETDLPDLRPVGVKVDHGLRSVSLLTSDEEFTTLIPSLM
ncbi:hypothetical protein [Nocardiopsis lambiniae]|uniref:Uncharacterized protein n=1 Tax=Nocardiopsis lambiniae TaxID=3075539 RepID=A0ABU2M979_9ACTN|nr:hypothetical protein [Nocardiopsis sp. DSM 44743]MDT0329222.1 hypothetical protein [Nocardiopsis sp. DSM 44743]